MKKISIESYNIYNKRIKISGDSTKFRVKLNSRIVRVQPKQVQKHISQVKSRILNLFLIKVL